MTAARIILTNGDQVTDIVAIDSTGPKWTYTDVDGDDAVLYPAKIPGVGPGIYLRTSKRGCSIAIADIEDFITAIRATVAAVTEAVDDDDPQFREHLTTPGCHKCGTPFELEGPKSQQPDTVHCRPVPPGQAYTSDETGGISYRLGRWDADTWELTLPYTSSHDNDEFIGETYVEREYVLEAGSPGDLLEAIADLLAVLQVAAAHVKAVDAA